MHDSSPIVLPLNDTQRLLRYWQAYQPYLAIDAIEARETVDVDRLRASAEDELALLGLGMPIASDNGLSVSYMPCRPALQVERITPSAGVSALTALAERCSLELNHRFQAGVDPLIRLWVVESQPNAHLGMTWQHWPMDGVSGADLFRRILCRYVGAPLAENETATSLNVLNAEAALAPWRTWRRRFGYIRHTMAEALRGSRIYAVPRPAASQAAVRVELLELPYPPRPDGATLNDVVAAALIWAIAEHVPERQHSWWRRRINLMNIVDLRPFGGAELSRAWGFFLGFCFFHLPEPRPARWEDLVRSFRDQSLAIKEGGTFFASQSTTRMLRQHWPWFPERWRWSLPYALTPSTASLSTTRHRAEWCRGPLGERFGRSWRVAPLGGLVPLIATACNKGNQLSIALTFEERGLVGERIEGIKEVMRRLLGG